LRFCLIGLLAAAALAAQIFETRPPSVRQGETIRVRNSSTASSVRMNGRTVRLFPQMDGAWFGLMPVPHDQVPGKYPLEFLDRDGSVLHTTAITVRDARFAKQNVVMMRAVQELAPAQGEMDLVAAFRRNVSDQRYWDDPLAAPVPGCLLSPFGVARLHNGKPTGNYHSGVDQRSPAGKPVRAVAGGVVRLVRALNLHGGTVGVDHGQGLESIYLHLSRFAVGEGAVVKKGDLIGYVGSTGRSTGPHLHWSLYANGVPVTPLQWISLKSCAAPRTRSRYRRR
jgi:murein DD-endopeptidase MepM/ murein hydrolase activator NlpD